MQITQDILKTIAPRLADNYESVNNILNKYEINTVNRIAGFFAQCGHESGDFSITKENLNYSENGLLKIFPKYFTATTASQYAKHPEMIGNKVYADRMGNGPESSGDGFKYRGRGYIQLTGKENYQAFADFIDKSLQDTVIYLETFNGALESACWFWKTKKLNEICDNDDIVLMTKRINGGTIGLEERTEKYNNIKNLLA